MPEYEEYFFDEMKKDFNNYYEYYEKEIEFSKIEPRFISIFNNVMESINYKEFNLKNELYTLNNEINNLKI